MEETRLEKIRKNIDGIDDRLLVLLRERMEQVARIAKYKQEHGILVQNDERERQILKRVSEKCNPAIASEVGQIFQRIFEVSRCYQSNVIKREIVTEQERKNSLERNAGEWDDKR